MGGEGGVRSSEGGVWDSEGGEGGVRSSEGGVGGVGMSVSINNTIKVEVRWNAAFSQVLLR